MKTLTTYVPIELTDKQKNRLIRMSTHFFPNRNFKFFDNGMFGHDTISVSELNKKYVLLEVNWMEFLLYKVIPAYNKKYGPISLTWNMKNFQKEEINLIDEFYKKFKTIL